MKLAMNKDIQIMAYEAFVKAPSAKTAYDFIISCHKYIGIAASKWIKSGLDRRTRINEIITEMLLILLEDFSSDKAVVPKAAFAYLDIKLKRLVNPGRRRIFMDIDSIKPSKLSEENNFTFEKIDMVKQIVQVVRGSIFSGYGKNTGLVPFLFIHIYPKIHWISELLAAKDNDLAQKRYEADAKRLNRFNAKLRKKFDSLDSGDWRDIIHWSQTERRHLAWKIINISPTEIDSNVFNELEVIENWRENFDVHSQQKVDLLISAEKIYQSMANNFIQKEKSFFVEEEAEEWGSASDVISLLIGEASTEIKVEESVKTYKDLNNNPDSPEIDLEFMEVAQELSKWFGNLLSQRNKKAVEKTLNW